MLAFIIIFSLLFIGYINFLSLTRDYITLPVPAEERLDTNSIQLITESVKNTLKNA